MIYRKTPLGSRSSQRDLALQVDHSKRRFLVAASALSCAALLHLQPAAALSDAESNPKLPIKTLLEDKVEVYLRLLRRTGQLSSDEQTAWSVYDLSLEQKLVAINENTPYQTASMIKPFVALAFFYKVAEQGSIFKFDKKHKSIMEDMIKNSSNSATNYFINLLSGREGRPREVEHILKKHAPEVFKDTRIIERIPANGRTYLNQASAGDYNRFLYTLWHDQFPYSQELKALMQLPNKDRIYTGAKQVASETQVIDKTGTTARLCGNMGILIAKGINGKNYPYTFIAIIEKAERTDNYGQWAVDRGNIIRQVSNIVYTELKKIHNLT